MDHTITETQHARSILSVLQSFGVEVDPTGLEVTRLIRRISNLYEAIAGEHLQDAEVSGPRWRLLLRLYVEEVHGNMQGVSPTHLSHCQNVSKNTISALLRGLEEQGLVERALDPLDKRGFRIRLSQAGRDLLVNTTPRHLEHLNCLVSGLSPDERTQLIELLGKLQSALLAHAPS